MRLNFDVLLVAMSMLQDRVDIGRMMRTCWTMYHAGASYVLNGQENVRTPLQLISICGFMLN